MTLTRLLSEIKPEGNEKSFYVMNDYAQWYCGLKRGKASFSDNFNEARTLQRNSQFIMLKKVSDYPIEKVEL